MATIRLSVNGKPRSVDTEPDRPLLEVLREDLGLTGQNTAAAKGSAERAPCLSTASRRFPA